MNEEVRATVLLAAFPTTQNFDIPVGNGFTAKARIWLPSNFNASKKYPLFVDVYGGPGSAKISDRYVVDWSISLVSDHEIIYAAIDGRGSGHQSDDYMFQINRRLGTYEIEDQIAGAKWLINNLNYIDPNRTAIWGWSYGGYATAMVMGTDKGGVYKCGISVAPVTSWLFYDTIYTERYMGLPTMEDNYDAYNTSDVTHHIENFRNKKFFIVHGNADDNVHYQQSMILSRALERADILFRQQSYPDENHSLGGVRRHLYHSLEEFLFTECF
jgi:dipeptidyl-peptidase-4